MNKKISKILIWIFIISHLLCLLLLVFYQLRVSSYCGLKVESNSPFRIFVSTPFGQFEETSGSVDEVTLYPRPISSVKLLVVDKNIEFNNISGIDTCFFLPNNELLKITKFGSQKQSIIQTIKWALNLNYVKDVLYLIYSLFIITLILLNIILLKNWLFLTFNKIKRYYFRHILSDAFLTFPLKSTKLPIWQYVLSFCFLIIFCGQVYFNVFHDPLLQESITENTMESRRVLVAQEMKLSGNYFVSTRIGEVYVNKPPMGHYVLIPFVDSENNPEGKMRLVAFSFILLSSIFLYFSLSKILKNQMVSLITSIAFLLNVFFFLVKGLQLDYLLGLVSLILFLGIYYFANKGNYLSLFLFAYSIACVGFLIKGYVFLYYTLVALFVVLLVNKNLKKFLSFYHLYGIILFIVVLSGYLIVYSKYSSPTTFILQQLSELNHISSCTLSHRIGFMSGFWGFIMIGYAPIMLLLPILLLKKSMLVIIRNPFLKYCILVSLLNLGVYWISPEFQFHYIIAFVPLIYCCIFYLLFTVDYSLKDKLVVVFASVLIISLSYFFPFPTINNIFLMIMFGVLLLIVFIMLFVKKKYLAQYIFIAFVFSIPILISVSNHFKERNRNLVSLNYQSKQDCKRIACNRNFNNVCRYSQETIVRDAVAYYIQYYKKQLLPTAKTNSELDYYEYFLINKVQITQDMQVVDSIGQFIYGQRKNRRQLKKHDYLYLVKNLLYSEDESFD